MTCAGLLFVARLRLWRERRQWSEQIIGGHEVLVASNLGPAVIGVIRPRIVLPAWLVSSSHETRTLVLAHEREHIAASDHLIAITALLAIVIVPWNMPLWWQLRRLRFAIEVDCDARVLRTGADARGYGEMLIAVGERRSHVPVGAIALTEPVSQLERRIRIMMKEPHRRAALSMAASMLVALSMVTAAAQVHAPDAGMSAELRLLPPDASNPDPIRQHAEQVARSRFPDVFAGRMSNPVSIEILFNVDMSVDLAELVPVAPDATPLAREHFLDRLVATHGLDRRDVGLLIQLPIKVERADAPAATLLAAARRVHPSRSAAVVEAAVKAHFPDLYTSAAQGQNVLVTALMGEDGKVVRADQEIIAGSPFAEDQSGARFERLGLPKENIGAYGLLAASKERPSPSVVYAYAKTGDPLLDANARTRIATPGMAPPPMTGLPMERKLVGRHFPDALDMTNASPQILWLALDREGSVILSGRTPLADKIQVKPEFFAETVSKQLPALKIWRMKVLSLGAVLGRPAQEWVGKQLLVGFAWMEPAPVGGTSQPAAQARGSETAMRRAKSEAREQEQIMRDLESAMLREEERAQRVPDGREQPAPEVRSGAALAVSPLRSFADASRMSDSVMDLRGNVLIESTALELRGDNAEIPTASPDGALIIHGRPATFALPANRDVTGSARDIRYSTQTGEIVLSGDASLKIGDDVMRGGEVTYSIPLGRVLTHSVRLNF